MVQYEIADSPFFKANKAYCEKIEALCLQQNGSTEGYCNAFGYELKNKYTIRASQVELILKKAQTLQNGVLVAQDSRDHAVVEIRIDGMPLNRQAQAGRSLFKRLLYFLNSRQLSAPYYLKAGKNTDQAILAALVSWMQSHQLFSFDLKDGTLHAKLHGEATAPFELVNSLLNLFKV